MRRIFLTSIISAVVVLLSLQAHAHLRIHFSTTGELGVGDIKYDGSSSVTHMIEYQGGVLTAFANCGPPNPQPACVHWSQNGQGLGEEPRAYVGTSPVTAMVAYNGGVLTAFANCGPPNPQPACIHWSPDGKNIGAGPRVYAGSSPVTAMVAYNGGVLTAFANCGATQSTAGMYSLEPERAKSRCWSRVLMLFLARYRDDRIQ